MSFYVNVFVIVAAASGAIIHFVTREQMPWWPDTAIMGAVFGAIAALGMVQHRGTYERVWRTVSNHAGRADRHDGGRAPRRQPSELYSAMFSVAAVGLCVLIAGLIGYDMNRHAAFRAGTRWAKAPIAWEIAAGAALLLIAGFIFRRLTRWVVGGAAPPGARSVGSGRTAGAENGTPQRQLPSDHEP